MEYEKFMKDGNKVNADHSTIIDGVHSSLLSKSIHEYSYKDIVTIINEYNNIKRELLEDGRVVHEDGIGQFRLVGRSTSDFSGTKVTISYRSGIDNEYKESLLSRIKDNDPTLKIRTTKKFREYLNEE